MTVFLAGNYDAYDYCPFIIRDHYFENWKRSNNPLHHVRTGIKYQLVILSSFSCLSKKDKKKNKRRNNKRNKEREKASFSFLLFLSGCVFLFLWAFHTIHRTFRHNPPSINSAIVKPLPLISILFPLNLYYLSRSIFLLFDSDHLDHSRNPLTHYQTIPLQSTTIQ